MIVKLHICLTCAAKLKVVLATKGEDAMAAEMMSVLRDCGTCRHKLPNQGRGMTATMKKTQ